MNKEEVVHFKRDLIAAFERRTPNTTSLEVMRLLNRFPPHMREKLRAEWHEQANPENAWRNAHFKDFQFVNEGSITVLLLLLAGHHPAFAFTDEQWAGLSACDDELEAINGSRPFTDPISVLNSRNGDDGPEGMD